MILPKIRVLHSHGRQAIPDLDAVELTPEFRGRPCLTETRDADDAEHAAAVCPTGALTAAPPCARPGPLPLLRRMRAHRAPQRPFHQRLPHRLAHARRTCRPSGDPRIAFDAGKVRPEIRRCFSRALQLREVSAGGDASVEMELGATGNVNFDLGRFGIGFTGLAAPCRRRGGLRPRHGQHGRGAGNLLRRRRGTQNPRRLRFGGLLGGLFADSRAVDRTFFDTHTPDLWLPGAPTHPMTYIDGMMNLLGRKTRQ